ncbi:MAG TPA: phosphatase PAP2 family protein [Iamia sp.]|nr:phosphatase PAP2 family protein [Iamia sp.]
MTEVDTDTTDSTDASGPDEPATASGRRLRWWREVAYVIAFYLVYSWVRNQFGSAGEDSTRIAYEHARDIIRIQDAIGLWFEPELQRWYLDLPGMGLIRAWNIYYGTAHFIVTAGALVWLYRRQPDRYSLWRSTLAAMTAAALIGFAGYSLMPPRLLGDTSRFGACFEQQEADCHGDGVVDTLAVHGGWLSFQDEEVAEVSNQFAAMPSMHTGWSTWSAFVMWGLVRRRWAKVLVVLYPMATVFCILITGNHYWLDAIGGLAAFAVGLGVSTLLTRWNDGRFARREQRRAATA